MVHQRLHGLPRSSRTRLVHGALPLDHDHCITVYTSRRRQESLGVMLRMARGSLRMFGTRAALEAEGLVPPDTQWPQGRKVVQWQAWPFQWTLSRTRPEGLKGPQSLWIDGDWWVLASSPADKTMYFDRQMQLMQAEMLYEWRRRTWGGHCELAAHRQAYRAARGDNAFQRFKAGVLPPPRRDGRATVRPRQGGAA